MGEGDSEEGKDGRRGDRGERSRERGERWGRWGERGKGREEGKGKQWRIGVCSHYTKITYKQMQIASNQ